MRNYLKNNSLIQWLNKQKFLIAFFLLFSSGVTFQRQINQPETFSVDSKNIENELHKLEEKLTTLVTETKQNYLNGKFFEADSLSTWLIDSDYSEYTQKSFTVLIYKNDSLRFWSDNSVPVPFNFSESQFADMHLLNIGNGWFIVRKETIQDGYIVGLLRIKNSYSYENIFLDNSFRDELRIPATVKISIDPTPYGTIIRDNNGKDSFWLVPVSNVSPTNSFGGWLSLLYILSFAFLLLYINEMYKQIAEQKNGEWLLLGLTVLLLVARAVMVKFKFPFFIYSLLFFEPEIYTGNTISPYLGDLILNAILILFLGINIFRIVSLEQIFTFVHKRSKPAAYSFTIILLVSVSLFMSFTTDVINDFVQNSNIEFRIHLITKLNLFSVSAYLIIILLLTTAFILIDRFVKLFALHIPIKLFFILAGVSILLSFAFYFTFHKSDYEYLTAFTFIALTFITITRYVRTEYHFYTLTILVLVASVFTIATVYEDVEQNQRDESQVLISQLEDERDVVAELLLNEISDRMREDPMLIRILTNIIVDHKLTVHDYLKRKYFNGFWEKYKLTTTLCGNTIYYTEGNQAESCERYFLNNIKEFGHKLENSDFYFIGNRDGTITYFGKFSVPISVDDRQITVYIQLKEILTDIRLGYPDLLIDESDISTNMFANYSYAKYRKGKLVSKSGDYAFDLSDKAFADQSNSAFIVQEGYVHHLHRSEQGNLIVLSRRMTKPFDYVTAFAYLFVFLNLILLLSVLISNPGFLIKKFKPDFNNRIRFSMLFILLVTFLLFTAGTIYYAVKRHQEIQNEQLTEKMQSVLTELKHKLAGEEKLTPEWKATGYDHLDELLIKFSQIFFVDINVYDLDGFLLATSRPEIFERGLISKQMNSSAYNELVFNKKALIIRKEQIGELSYSSVYIPFENKDNKVIAYVNLPYFTDDDNLQKNISNLLITTINIYVILFLLAIVLAFFISTNITRPLRMLQSKFKNVELGKKHQEISYKKDDEVGALVTEYNRMVAELEKSVKKLAESERENAWREMAKQIAHEIKNPLTPMKLSVQLLQRSWNDNKENFETRLNGVSNTLIEQIDTLSSIASEFSAFAKMPKAQDEEVNLSAKLQTVVQLFENTRDADIKIDLHGNNEVYILADKEQISRVFINIIKNGIQSIPEGVRGKIYVELTTYANYAKVTIEDNGSGIPDDRKGQLFKPSFTTKTTGMGMGLAIVKNIINSSNGEIWFESELGKGTKFFVEFPLLFKS